MRSLLFLALIIPAIATAQINRSAREFASERIQEYIVKKLFKDLAYKPGSFGQLKSQREDKNPELAWTIEHNFEITENRNGSVNKAAIPKLYKFLFYLDEKMKVLRAEVFYTYKEPGEI